MTTPEDRRDIAIEAIIRAGGVVRGADPRAHHDDPYTVVAYRLRVGNPQPGLVDLEAVRDQTEVDDSSLVDLQYVEAPDDAIGN